MWIETGIRGWINTTHVCQISIRCITDPDEEPEKWAIVADMAGTNRDDQYIIEMVDRYEDARDQMDRIAEKMNAREGSEILNQLHQIAKALEDVYPRCCK